MPEPLRSVHTSNIPDILHQLGISILVTTYQAGRLVMLRAQDTALNTHFRSFDKPMGLAIDGNRLAVGTANQIWEFHNLPAVCEKVDAKIRASDPASPVHHDACLLPRTTHWTGDIQIHEMDWVNGAAGTELWAVNTRFSCLCRRSDVHSFEPVWRPSFIPHFVPGDCCHLNGLATRDGQARYVTALGETHEVEGWRKNKRNGGILIDIESDQVMAHGLSMPHSPRWHQGHLWVLQSGIGELGIIDPANGSYQSVAKLPGFTRGLSFVGPLALIGLSQVRESAIFGGVPIAEAKLDQRVCGVWVVNIETGETVGFVRFEDAVHEIFAVEIWPTRYPELINDDQDLLAGSFELADEALADVPTEMRRQ
ncbi:hypothetical protein K227x_62990 [Rubripirellula lacrimiformis]|uniref:Conserved hypothetical protein CHP03032 domain-containing protein n=1 Tax=Rubripirellula lacrimiformis TaxID=1930273 RepID=A0A517NL62_9BACT|nr:TIGR03032 family protein [Rubripirellula lacrimiformis]QDT07870.1 hypothetical protein K227x_62990 [Rubripirellula lacrimiformis]